MKDEKLSLDIWRLGHIPQSWTHAILPSGCQSLPRHWEAPSSSTVMDSTTSLINLLTSNLPEETTVELVSEPSQPSLAPSNPSDPPPFPLALVLSCVLVAYLIVLLILIGVRFANCVGIVTIFQVKVIYPYITRSYITRRGLAAECCGVSDTDSTCHDFCSSGL